MTCPWLSQTRSEDLRFTCPSCYRTGLPSLWGPVHATRRTVNRWRNPMLRAAGPRQALQASSQGAEGWAKVRREQREVGSEKHFVSYARQDGKKEPSATHTDSDEVQNQPELLKHTGRLQKQHNRAPSGAGVLRPPAIFTTCVCSSKARLLPKGPPTWC